MNKKLILTIAIVTLIGGLLGGYISGLVGGNQSGTLGGSTSDSWSVGGNLTVAGDTTLSGGDLTVTTGVSATSTLTVGEIETYATSSATKICLKFNTIATSSQAGYVLWNYGTCP